ncbi:Hypothetical protein BROD_2347 [Brucella sp. NF 2653]|nr:Hypothetical protein BROD_2347 [Brucella sp. NF 2653]
MGLRAHREGPIILSELIFPQKVSIFGIMLWKFK